MTGGRRALGFSFFDAYAVALDFERKEPVLGIGLVTVLERGLVGINVVEGDW